MTADAFLTDAVADIDRLSAGRFGTFDVPCPICGPQKHKRSSQRKPTLRIWRLDEVFSTFHCARCGERGYVRDHQAVTRVDPARIEQAKAEAAERERVAAGERLSKALWLWSKRQPIAGSIAETYLQTRGYLGPLPATLAFLPPRGGHGPAMIAAFGLPTEPEPGRLAMRNDAVRGVHLTRLAPDGIGKAGTDTDKIMIGLSAGSPIVVAPPNDLLGLVIVEGIEDALSAHLATGLGAWAAGAASRLPAIAAAVPNYIESVTLLVDDDNAGRRHAGELGYQLNERGFEVRLILPGVPLRKTAA